MNEKMIIEAYCRIRKIDNTIPDDVLDFMKDAAIEKIKAMQTAKCECAQSGTCRFEIIVAESKEVCRYKE